MPLKIIRSFLMLFLSSCCTCVRHVLSGVYDYDLYTLYIYIDVYLFLTLILILSTFFKIPKLFNPVIKLFFGSLKAMVKGHVMRSVFLNAIPDSSSSLREYILCNCKVLCHIHIYFPA